MTDVSVVMLQERVAASMQKKQHQVASAAPLVGQGITIQAHAGVSASSPVLRTMTRSPVVTLSSTPKVGDCAALVHASFCDAAEAKLHKWQHA